MAALFAACLSGAQTINEISADPPPAAPLPDASEPAAKNDISYPDAVVLGIVEGLTEYLPVSSTGHLIIANAFLGLDSREPLFDADGNPVLNGRCEPVTLKAAADAYAVVIQLGAIAAVAFVYWECLVKMFFGLLGRNPEGLRLLRNIMAAFAPAAAAGLLLGEFIESALFGVVPVIAALFFGALLMLWTQRRYASAHASPHSPRTRLENMRARSALLIGILQCVAMWPGTSRSMMTIVGGYAVGLRPADSARFSFLLGLVTLSAASAYKILKDGDALLRAVSSGPLLLGMAVAFAAAAVSVRWLVEFLTRRGLAPFAYYRIALALILGALAYFNFI